MRIRYDNLELQFTIDGTRFQVLNLVLERLERTIPAHSHGLDCYEVHYIPRGRGWVQLNGTAYPILPNTLFLTGPQVVHAQTPDPKDPMEEYCLYFQLRRISAPTGRLLPLLEQNACWFGQDCQQLLGILETIFQELKRKPTGYLTQVNALLQQFVVHLARNFELAGQSQELSQSSVPYSRKSMIMEEYFLYHYQDLNLEDLSRRLGVTPRQTQRLLQTYYGKNFRQKKNEARMSMAAILLRDTTRTITSIGEELGYSSAEHFSNAFRRYYHQSAREFRKQKRC